MLNGYDISDNQGNIDNTVVPGDFAIIKATEGIGYTDPDCDANYQQAKGAGKKLGVYGFGRPDGNPVGADEADWFLSQVQGYIGEAVLILDLERTPANDDPASWALSWLDRVWTKEQVRPWVYMNESMANSYDWSRVAANYSLWVAGYGMDQPQNGYTPSTGVSVNGNWTIAAWQYTSKGRLSGWGDFLDLNVFYGNAEEWDKYAAKQIPVPSPAPVPAPVPQPAPVVEPPVVVPTPPVTPSVTPPVVEPVLPPVVPPVTPIIINPVTEPIPMPTKRVVTRTALGNLVDKVFDTVWTFVKQVLGVK